MGNPTSEVRNERIGRGRRVIVQIVVRLVKGNLLGKMRLLSGSAGECLGSTGCQRGFGGNLWGGSSGAAELVISAVFRCRFSG
jgi:hypothetical protein